MYGLTDELIDQRGGNSKLHRIADKLDKIQIEIELHEAGQQDEQDAFHHICEIMETLYD